ncbi:MAG: hypothetical protein H0U60_05175 [Blastocatellia bacterium]|nr:hypothetical protein [Blastocatellia bacterium]
MKLCSQCEFIYEDDQERCDMDGAELVYEPTLEHVFQNDALQATTELERRVPARLVIPLSRLPQPETSIAQPHVFANRSRLALQIAALAVLAAVSFMAFYATPRLFQTGNQTASNRLETQNSEPKTSHPTPSVAVARAAASSEKLETQETKRDALRSSNEPETPSAKRETAFPALPGLKPLPRLKPLPTLKPIPRLSDRSGPVNAGRKAIVVNTSGNTKKDSRFGSFLKKTGRILTKPFKS